MDNFLNADKENRSRAAVTGKQKQEVGLLVPADFTGRTKKRNISTTLHRELGKKKEKYSGHFDVSSVEYNGKMYPSIVQWNICLFHNFIVLPIIAVNKRCICLRYVQCLFKGGAF